MGLFLPHLISAQGYKGLEDETAAATARVHEAKLESKSRYLKGHASPRENTGR